MKDIEPTPKVQSFMELGLSPNDGDEVITLTLEDTHGMLAYGKNTELIDNRRPGMEGVILGYVPGYGGDVWYVDHYAEAQAVYTISEIAPKQK